MMKQLSGKEARNKISELRLIKVDDVNWWSYYLDEQTNEKWKEDRPESEYHGGGEPRLTLIRDFPWEKLTEIER